MADDLREKIRECRLCAEQFSRTHTAHEPRPVVWFRKSARILIAGQAPGARVHESGRPFTDPSGDRLREWLGLTEDEFYDQDRIAIVPAAFCFPGYDAKGSDLPPPPRCADAWFDLTMSELVRIELRILVGGYAHKGHLGTGLGVTETVRAWRDFAPHAFVLPHPSWRNTGWLKRNPWFTTDVLPALRAQVTRVLADP